MKKLVIPATVLLALILCFAGYKMIWGGKVQFTAFHYQESEYELFAKLALDYHNGLKSDSESTTLLLFDTYFEDVTNDKTVELYGDEQDLLYTTADMFDVVTVYTDAVFFREDETGYFGLVYSKHPLRAIYKHGLPQGRSYHRIKRHWYEWGVWGI